MATVQDNIMNIRTEPGAEEEINIDSDTNKPYDPPKIVFVSVEEANKFRIDVAIAVTALDAVGETVLCDGALVNNLAGIGAVDGQIVVTTGGTVTAGKFVLTTVYEELLDRAES